ncbi:MAG: hypothetical protein KJP02_09255 [Octadecabacter sp.]|nr:hypothetical protein [Octadecabacter sp.]
MAVARDLGKSLDLFLTTPDMVWHERADGRRTVKRSASIASDSGVVSAFARTTTASGLTIDSVVTFDTATPTALQAAYWHIGKTWYEPAYPEDRPALFKALGIGKDAVFPYTWVTHVPLAPPSGHGISATRRFLRKFF